LSRSRSTSWHCHVEIDRSAAAVEQASGTCAGLIGVVTIEIAAWRIVADDNCGLAPGNPLGTRGASFDTTAQPDRASPCHLCVMSTHATASLGGVGVLRVLVPPAGNGARVSVRAARSSTKVFAHIARASCSLVVAARVRIVPPDALVCICLCHGGQCGVPGHGLHIGSTGLTSQGASSKCCPTLVMPVERSLLCCRECIRVARGCG